MLKRKIFFISVGSCLLLAATAVRAGWFGSDFSAEVVQGNAQGQRVSGRMYVSAGRVRTEMKQNDQLLVEIINPRSGVAWLLEPQRKRYRERAVPKLTAGEGKSANPCSGIAGASCRALPDEILNGRSTKKWLLQLNGKERLQWNDARHGFPTQVVEGGQVVMAMLYLSEEKLAGRRVEHWRALQNIGGAVVESEQWYDPQLNIAIRQQSKDGAFRQLRNIRLGKQADELFALPQGYRNTDASPAGQ
jgi:hypothetical protein